MGPDAIIAVLIQGVIAGSLVMGPILLTGLVIGISVGAVQAATQVNEPTLTFVPKAIGVGIVGAMLLPWGLDRMVLLVQTVMSHLARVS